VFGAFRVDSVGAILLGVNPDFRPVIGPRRHSQKEPIEAFSPLAKIAARGAPHPFAEIYADESFPSGM
jgi:hypothetical protein